MKKAKIATPEFVIPPRSKDDVLILLTNGPSFMFKDGKTYNSKGKEVKFPQLWKG